MATSPAPRLPVRPVLPVLPVLIIGSGLGGLTLAQALAKHHIPFRIFERDAIRDQRFQGYRIRIHQLGLDALRECLPPRAFARFEETCAVNVKLSGRIDARTGQDLPGRMGPANGPPPGQPTPGTPSEKQPFISLPADRRVMREALMTDLNPPITYSKAFTKYTTTPSCVTAHFADGSSAEGSLLIGADGIRSRVAAQLTGGRVEVIDLARMIFGRTPITRDVEIALHPSLGAGMALVVDPKDPNGQLNLFVEAMRFTHQGANPDYIHWVLTGTPPHFGVDDTTLLACDGSSARHFSLKATSAWDRTIRALLEHQDPRHTSVLRLTSSSPRGVVQWQTDRRVTLLGDAVHSMSPTGGSGANTALWDAQTLAQILASGVAEDGWTTDAIGEYETRIREFAGKQVKMSYQAASHGFGVKLPD